MKRYRTLVPLTNHDGTETTPAGVEIELPDAVAALHLRKGNVEGPLLSRRVPQELRKLASRRAQADMERPGIVEPEEATNNGDTDS